jgi:hypothetical protein
MRLPPKSFQLHTLSTVWGRFRPVLWDGQLHGMPWDHSLSRRGSMGFESGEIGCGAVGLGHAEDAVEVDGVA